MSSDNKRYAIVIGVTKYADDVSELPCAKNDAYSLYLALQKHSGFLRDRVYLLANGFDSRLDVPSDLPTRSNVLQKIKYVCDAAGPSDLILLYFAGHGAEISKTPYLITSDTRMDVLSQTALNVDEINRMLEGTKAKCIVRIFDACRSPFAQGRASLGRMTDGLQQAVMKCAAGWASFASCSSGEVAHESGELNHGVFTYYLCEGIAGKARNQQGTVTMESLVDYVKTSVANWGDRQTLIQTPHFQSDLSGSLVLSTPVTSVTTTPKTIDSPFGELIIGIEQHLSATAVDTRRLTFTNEVECGVITNTLQTQVEAKLIECSHPAIKAQIGKSQALSNFGGQAWQEFNNDLVSCQVQKEFAHTAIAWPIDFLSTEVVVPKTRLLIAVVQFNFFYWLWYFHACQAKQIQGSFQPVPPWAKGFFTLKPLAAKDPDKIDQTLSELLSRASREILVWAKQLGDYVETRIDPLRKIGPIVE